MLLRSRGGVGYVQSTRRGISEKLRCLQVFLHISRTDSTCIDQIEAVGWDLCAPRQGVFLGETRRSQVMRGWRAGCDSRRTNARKGLPRDPVISVLVARP